MNWAARFAWWCLATVAILAAAGGAAEPDAPERRPDVLFISIDDLNDWIGGLAGYPGVKTPNIDRLAARGVLFTRAYCAAPACNPSRTSLLTGRRPSSTGVYHNTQPWIPVMRDAVTLPRYFRDNGYRVAGAGKIFHGGFNDPEAWDEYLPRPADARPAVTPASLPNGNGVDWAPMQVPDSAMGDYQVLKWVEERLNDSSQEPLFLAAGFFRPHLPWYVPEEYYRLYPLDQVQRPLVKPGDLSDVPSPGLRMAGPDGDHRRITSAGKWEAAIQGYLASISFADRMVGRLLDALDKSGRADRTVIVLWGDHGWHLGEKQHWRKFTLWEEATRTPLIIVPPGGRDTAGRCERTVNLLDIYPTLLDLCRLPENRRLEGRSLVPLLRNPARDWPYPAVTTHGRNNHAVRTERWRYIRYGDGSEELYDHDVDPQEWTNLAKESDSAAIKRELRGWIPRVNVPDAPEIAGRSRDRDAEIEESGERRNR